tara:strand:- start:57 stop:254 length:198 start_codon:yes stop_codon:yes gene_type:complete
MNVAELFTHRLDTLRQKLSAAGIDTAVITDDDSVYYYSGHYGYLHMDSGRSILMPHTEAHRALWV